MSKVVISFNNSPVAEHARQLSTANLAALWLQCGPSSPREWLEYSDYNYPKECSQERATEFYEREAK